MQILIWQCLEKKVKTKRRLRATATGCHSFRLNSTAFLCTCWQSQVCCSYNPTNVPDLHAWIRNRHVALHSVVYISVSSKVQIGKHLRGKCFETTCNPSVNDHIPSFNYSVCSTFQKVCVFSYNLGSLPFVTLLKWSMPLHKDYPQDSETSTQSYLLVSHVQSASWLFSFVAFQKCGSFSALFVHFPVFLVLPWVLLSTLPFSHGPHHAG